MTNFKENQLYNPSKETSATLENLSRHMISTKNELLNLKYFQFTFYEAEKYKKRGYILL